MPGMFTSVTTTSNACFASRSSASSPEDAVTQLRPSPRSCRDTTWVTLGSSSTTRIETLFREGPAVIWVPP